MSWDSVLLNPWPSDANLPSAIDQLFSSQREDWETFRQGVDALSSIRAKTLTHDGTRVVVQANPGRCKSTHAKTDAESVATRKCFLCPDNMPPQERGIAFGELVILPNPYPILRRHCTIPDREHRPQQLAGHVGTMLELANKIGPDMLVFYNGPRCGASAPDHFHFQACDAGSIPLFAEPLLTDSSTQPFAHESFGRRMLVFTDANASAIQEKIERAVAVLKEITASDEEPMLNLTARYRDGRYLVVLFPRAAHRPACYFSQEPERLAISPATLEMSGVLVVAEPEHFDRVDAETARNIYLEVSLDPSQFSQLLSRLR